MSETERTTSSASLLRDLDALLTSKLRDPMTRAVEQARDQLARSAEAFGWAVVEPGAALLPAPTRSAWVFVLRADTRAEPHRHPSSVQHLRSLAGSGQVVLSREGARDHVEYALSEDHPWLVILEDVTHEVRATGAAEWVVASFHTVSANELLEVSALGSRRYTT